LDNGGAYARVGAADAEEPIWPVFTKGNRGIKRDRKTKFRIRKAES